MLNILIFPSGSKIAKEIYDSLKFDNDINIIGAEANDNNFTDFIYKNTIFNVPNIKEEELLIKFLNKINIQYNIHYIFPAYDTVNWFLSKNKDKINCSIIVNSFDIYDICLHLNKTHEILNKSISLPLVYNENFVEYPCIIRPNEFYNRKLTYKVNTKEELEIYKTKINNYVILEYLPGEEFVVDCFTNKKGVLLFCQGRQRKKTSMGISVHSYESNINFTDIATKINSILKFNGAWFFEIKYDISGNYKLLKIFPRIANSMALYRNKGINFPLLTVRQYEGDIIEKILYNRYNIECYKIYENRYKINTNYQNCYIELDNTIIIKNQVNLEIIKLLYHLINQNKNIFLITRNNDVKEILKKYKINDEIFNDIIIIKDNDKKSNFIKNNSIYIDHSFKDRYDVYIYKNLNVYDIDMIESLLDVKY